MRVQKTDAVGFRLTIMEQIDSLNLPRYDLGFVTPSSPLFSQARNISCVLTLVPSGWDTHLSCELMGRIKVSNAVRHFFFLTSFSQQGTVIYEYKERLPDFLSGGGRKRKFFRREPLSVISFVIYRVLF